MTDDYQNARVVSPMKAGPQYRIRPVNTDETYRWSVDDHVKLTGRGSAETGVVRAGSNP